MKKLLAILTVACVITACNNSAEEKAEEKKDTAVAAPSMAAEAQQLTDTVNKFKAAGDSIKDGASKMASGVKEVVKEGAKKVTEGVKAAGKEIKEAVKH